MKCPKCEADNREGAVLCHVCGRELEIVCTECGRVNRSDANFCDKCGRDLRTFEEQPHIGEDRDRSFPPEVHAEVASTSPAKQEVQDVNLVAAAAFDLFVSYVTAGEYSKIVDRAPKVIALIEKAGSEKEFFGKPSNPHSMFHAWNGFCLGTCGRFDEGEPWSEKGLAFAADLNHPYTLGMNEFFFGYFCCYRGNGEDAVKHLGNCVRHLEKSGGDEYLYAATSLLGFGYYHLGDLKEALELMNNGLNLHADLGIPGFLSFHHCHLSMAYLETGDLTRAMTHAQEGLQASRKTGEKFFEALARLLLGRICAKSDSSSLAEGLGEMRTGINMLEELKNRPYYAVGHLFLADAYSDAGDAEHSLENLTKSQSMFQLMGMHYWLGKTKEVLRKL